MYTNLQKLKRILQFSLTYLSLLIYIRGDCIDLARNAERLIYSSVTPFLRSFSTNDHKISPAEPLVLTYAIPRSGWVLFRSTLMKESIAEVKIQPRILYICYPKEGGCALYLDHYLRYFMFLLLLYSFGLLYNNVSLAGILLKHSMLWFSFWSWNTWV